VFGRASHELLEDDSLSREQRYVNCFDTSHLQCRALNLSTTTTRVASQIAVHGARPLLHEHNRSISCSFGFVCYQEQGGVFRPKRSGKHRHSMSDADRDGETEHCEDLTVRYIWSSACRRTYRT
jgi:hypothetical protein